jgi:hypothetical protein
MSALCQKQTFGLLHDALARAMLFAASYDDQPLNRIIIIQ